MQWCIFIIQSKSRKKRSFLHLQWV